jgi:hypothetical protein
MPLIVSKTRKVQKSKPLIIIEVQKSWSQVVKANPYKDPSTGRFTTGGTGAGTSSGAKVNVYDAKRVKELNAEIEGVWKEKRALEKEHDGLAPRAVASGYSPEDEKKWNDLDQKETDIIEARNEVSREFFDEAIEMKSGNTAANSDFGFDDEKFQKIRDEYVVPDELTLKTNAGLRRTGRVTTKVERFDEMVGQGTVANTTRVHRAAILKPEQVSQLEVATSYVDRGFQSVSIDRSTAEIYMDIRASNITGEKVLFEYDLQKGTNAVNVGYGEIVVQRSATVSITGITKQGDVTVVRAEVSKR